MTETRTYNAETAQMFQQVIAALERNTTTRQKQSTLQQLVSSVANGLEDLGQYGAAFGVLVGCGASVGAGLDRLDYVGGLSHGIGWGMVIGGVAVGARVVCDLGLSDLVLDVLNLRRKNDDAPQGAGASKTNSASGEKGLWIWDARGGEGKMLLPDLPQAQVLKMAQRTAVAYMTGRAKKHFSQDHLGKSWGAHLNDAKKVLAALGHIKLGANKTYTFTESGVEWLQGVID